LDKFYFSVNLDGPVKSRKSSVFVIPAKAGIQKNQPPRLEWTPAFAGVTDLEAFYSFVNLYGCLRLSFFVTYYLFEQTLLKVYTQS
jgi:hypothetical protein